MRMSARSSARFVGIVLAIGSAPLANAAELTPQAVGAGTAAISLPVFLDASRLPDMQAAWRTRFGGPGVVVAAPVVATDPEAGTINDARQTLTRAEQITIEAVAVRERAEELSRRFAISAGDEGIVSTAVVETVSEASTEGAATETASIDTGHPAANAEPTQAQEEAPAPIQQVAVRAMPLGTAPASMLGGPRVEEAAAEAEEPAPVIEDMATNTPTARSRQPVKRAAVNPPPRRVVAQTAPPSTGLFGIFSSWGSSEPEETKAKPDAADKEPMMPTEIRSFGWNAQP
jgi:hypothetical protein